MSSLIDTTRKRVLALLIALAVLVSAGVALASRGGDADAVAPSTTTTTSTLPPTHGGANHDDQAASAHVSADWRASDRPGDPSSGRAGRQDRQRSAPGTTADRHQPGRRRVRGTRRRKRHPAARGVPLARQHPGRTGPLGSHIRHPHRGHAAAAAVRLVRRQPDVRAADPGSTAGRRGLRRAERPLLP